MSISQEKTDGLVRTKSEWAASHIGKRSVLNIASVQGINSQILSNNGAFVQQPSSLKKDDLYEYLYQELPYSVLFERNSQLTAFECLVVSEDQCGEELSDGFLKRALTLLEANGTLIVVTQFGDEVDWEHRYYFESLFMQINSVSTVIGISVNTQWIGYIAIKIPQIPNLSLPEISQIEIGEANYLKSAELLKQYAFKSNSCIKEAILADGIAKDYIHAYKELLRSRSVQAILKARKSLGMRSHKRINSELPDYWISEYEVDAAEQDFSSCINSMLDYSTEIGQAVCTEPANETILNLALEARKTIERISANLRQEDSLKTSTNTVYPRLCKLLDKIPQSNGCNYYAKAPLHCGIVANPSAFALYQDALDLIDLSTISDNSISSVNDIDFILYAYRQADGYSSDEFEINKWVESVDGALVHTAKMGAPTVLIIDGRWDHRFDRLVPNVDFIFTSDAALIADQVNDEAASNVFLLRSGINPLANNPIGFLLRHYWKTSAFCESLFFAGAWDKENEQLERDMRFLLDSARNSSADNLIISDCTYLPDESNSSGSNYPCKYAGNIVKSFTERELQTVNKLFDFTLYCTTPNYLPDVHSSRLTSIQAAGSLVLANYSRSMSAYAPSNFMISNSEEIDMILGNYSEREIVNLQLENIRKVMSSCTVYNQLNDIFKTVGVSHQYPDQPVYVFAEDAIDGITHLIETQTYKNIIQINALNDLKHKNGYFILLDESSLAFGSHFIEDAINAFKFTDASYVNYGSRGISESSYSFVHGTATATNTLYSLDNIDVSEINNNEYLASLTGFEVLAPKWGRPSHQNAKDLAVVVPIYNNGRYLKDRCFLSLLRSSVFSKMHIYLVDDGSTDGTTRNIINEIVSAYDNVTSFFFYDVGSGSASRPRNKGTELAVEPYITYLDPDNEAIDDGYAQLLSKINNSDADFAAGFHTIVIGPSFQAVKNVPEFPHDLIENPKEILCETDFYPLSMQACIFKRSFLINNNLTSVEGAVGEDTLFYYEIMATAKSFYYLDKAIHIYYAERIGSAVNVPDRDFFNKSLKLEREQVCKLDNLGILDQYISIKLDKFFDEWYRVKLQCVDAKDFDYCQAIVKEIMRLYR